MSPTAPLGSSGPGSRPDSTDPVERAIYAALDRYTGPGTPPRLRAALEHALFPGGARLRPHLVRAIAAAHGISHGAAVDAAATSLELLHCASLVHDDLPCFDDAEVRRGKPTVHVAFGEATAVLVGDALIVMAFQVLAESGIEARTTAELVRIVGIAAGSVRGIVAGQAWECEPRVGLARYHQFKTGALFEAAARAGAVLARAPEDAWSRFGAAIGEAYQVADDLHDALGSQGMGKPAGQDTMHGRPNAVHALGIHGAVDRLHGLLERALGFLPSDVDRRPLDAWLASVGGRLVPDGLRASPSPTTREHDHLEAPAAAAAAS
jgi:geranylgeranyl diphosphate synthase type II